MIAQQKSVLFHSTGDIEILKSIITNGFYPSYAKEVFAGRDQQILMVSVSCIPLNEIDKQVGYGQYSIGLDINWGIKNKFHPVLYTFEYSKFENSVVNLIEISTAASTLPTMINAKKSNIPIYTKGVFLEKIKNLANENLTEAQADKIEDITNYVFEAAHSLNLFAKNYKVLLKDGNEHMAFFDREWRYIPKAGLNGATQLIFKTDAASNLDPNYKYWNEQKKPHGISMPLSLKLDDIRYLLVNHHREIPIMRSFLEKEFEKEKVLHLIENGSLRIEAHNKGNCLTRVFNKIRSHFPLY